MAVMGDERMRQRKARVRAWDLPTRLFHWSLVALMIAAYVTRKSFDQLTWHIWTGYSILVLIVFRVLWGFVGSSTARFSSFIHSPGAAIRYGIDFLLRRPRRFLGHNPLGSVAALAMIVLVGLQGVLGLFSYDDHTVIDGGPLSGRVSEATVASVTSWHLSLFYIILYVVGLHIVANILYVVWKGENLVGPMITGTKANTGFEDAPEARIAPLWRALVCLVLAAGIVFGGIILAGGKPF